VASDQVEHIKSRCYWHTIIRPETFVSNRVADYSRLFAIARDSAVSLRGWDFPHIDYRDDGVRHGEDWVGQEIDRHHHIESWRLYQSGQFVSVLGLWYDWEGRSESNPDGDGPVDFFPLWDTIYRFTEIYEFAARLALTEAADVNMRVTVKIGNLQNRVLVQDHHGKTQLRHYHYSDESFTYPIHDAEPIKRELLIANPRKFAAEAMVELFQRFGFMVNHESARSWQEELGKW